MPDARAAAANLRKIKLNRDKRPNNRLPLSETAMTYRSLLVLLDQGPQRAARSQAAIRLALALDCHLMGVAPIGTPGLAESVAPLSKFAPSQGDTLHDQVTQTTNRFRDECQAAGVRSFEALIDESDAASSLVHYAHCNDLTILTKADPAAPDHCVTQKLVDQVVLHSARPTLILPFAGRFDTIGSIGTHVMVAWDDSREAARALSDALPFLRLAKHVQIVSWSEAGATADQVLRSRFEELRQWLIRHGVSADVSAEMMEIDAGVVDAMLLRAADLKIDLIVMGGYGHTRSKAHTLDGTTSGLLAAITVPVLLSH